MNYFTQNTIQSLVLANNAMNGFFADKAEKKHVFDCSFSVACAIGAIIIIAIVALMIISRFNKGRSLEKIMLHEIMDKTYPASEKSETLKQAYDLMKNKKINALPVVKLNRVIGIIKKSTIERKLKTGEITSLETSAVATSFSRDVAVLSKTNNLREGLKLITEKNIDTIIIIGPENYYYGAVTREKLQQYI
jgi:predicted transcriptional regulator